MKDSMKKDFDISEIENSIKNGKLNKASVQEGYSNEFLQCFIDNLK